VRNGRRGAAQVVCRTAAQTAAQCIFCFSAGKISPKKYLKLEKSKKLKKKANFKRKEALAWRSHGYSEVRRAAGCTL